jgi:nucleotide-binding universal stress UspA family protein
MLQKDTNVVVGVQNSADSVAALRRAVAEARNRNARLDIVHVIAAGSDVQQAAAALRSFIADTFPHGIGVPSRARVEFGDPGQVLPRLAAQAALLVVGACDSSARRGIFSSPVVRACLAGATCPVVICADHGWAVADGAAADGKEPR